MADWWINLTALATTFPLRFGTAGSRRPQPGLCPLSFCTQKTREASSWSPDNVIYLQWRKESSWARAFFLLTVSQWQMANNGGKKNPLKSKKLVSFIWFQWGQTPGMFGSGSRVAAIQYQFSPHCCRERKKRKRRHSRRTIQSSGNNRNLSETLFVLFYWTPEPNTSIKTEDCGDTRMLAYIHVFYSSQTYICTSARSCTPLRAGDNCLAANAPTIVRLPGRKEPGNEEGEGEGSRLWVAPQSGYKGN